MARAARAEGALSKINAEVLATGMTLTCQISNVSKESGGR